MRTHSQTGREREREEGWRDRRGTADGGRRKLQEPSLCHVFSLKHFKYTL